MISRSLVFLHGRHIPVCREHFQKDYRDYCTIQYIASGALHLELDGDTYTMVPGRMWSARPGRTMRFRPVEAEGFWDHRYLAFRGSLAFEWVAAGLLPAAPITIPAGIGLPERFDAILESSRKPDRWSQLRAVDSLELLLLDVAGYHTGPRGEEGWSNRVLEELNRAAVSGMSPDYEAMARGLAVSVATLQRRFRRLTGMTLHDYLIQVRLAAAQALLADTDEPVGAIADRLGYRDAFYFARQFRGRVGSSPTEYRLSFRLRRSAVRPTPAGID